jgi:hypothetical protein
MNGREEKMNDGTTKKSNNSEERNLLKYNKWEEKSCRDRTERACGIILCEIGYQHVESEARENGERRDERYRAKTRTNIAGLVGVGVWVWVWASHRINGRLLRRHQDCVE